VNHNCKVTGYAIDRKDKPIDKAGECLTGCHLVLVPAGASSIPGKDLSQVTRKDFWSLNAEISKDIVEACAKHCPQAIIALIVNPVNSIVPAMAELWKKKGLNPTKIIGVTTLDSVRAEKFVHEVTDAPLNELSIPCIGGHAGPTIVPLFSQNKYSATLSPDKIADLDKRTQAAGREVIAAKKFKGAATLSMGYAGARLASAVLAGLAGTPTEACAFVRSSITSCPYFASVVTFGKTGVEKVHDVGTLSTYEQGRLDAMLPILMEEVQTGLDYADANELAD
jgi:malate dehydrogenase